MRMRKRPPFPVWVWIFLLYCVFTSKPCLSQTVHQLPPNQPEQDACTALTLCGSSFNTPYSYQGVGNVFDLPTTPCGSGEDNSVWLKVTVATAGTIAFKIIPIDPVDDYDFSVSDITNTTCSNPSNVVRCNFNNNEPGSNVNGIIGLDPSSQTPSVPGGSFGSSFCSVINASAGDTYLIMINNYGSDDIPGSLGAGFTIDFSGSSATFNQGAPPALSSIDKPCYNPSQITLHLANQVLCNSVDPTGTDFYTTPTASISAAAGVNCSGAAGYTNTVVINFSAAPPAGQYTLHVKNGTDGNTLLNLCSVPVPLSANISFNVPTGPPNTEVNLSICYTQLPYTWNGIIVTTGGSNAATYTTPSSSGCDSIVILNLTVSNPPVVTALPVSICNGQSYTLPWGDVANQPGVYSHSYPHAAGCDSAITNVTISIDEPATIYEELPLCIDSSKTLAAGAGYNNYLWNTGATTTSITIATPGIYTAQATDQLGCIAYDTFRVTSYPNAIIPLATNTFLCEGGTKTIDAGAGFLSYLWSTGSTTETININSTGSYSVDVKDLHGCPGTGTTVVSSVPLPQGFLLPDTVKCFYSTIILQPFTSFDSYLWSTGATSEYISVMDTGTYQLQVTDHNGCTGTASIRVRDSACQEYVYVPTAFTPNRDSKNDIFRPVFKGLLVQYHFAVFNRLGQKIFESSDPNTGWDGTINRQPQDPGAYVWFCSYQLYQQQPQTLRGTVVLIR